MPFDEMGGREEAAAAVLFEDAHQHVGIFREQRAKATRNNLYWLKHFLPVAARLLRQERFFRAFSVYEQAQWSSTVDISTVLVWTAIEALFDLGHQRDKTRAICTALSEYVSTSPSDRDRAYQVVRDMLHKRGSVVHVGRSIDTKDFVQSFQFARVAFRRVLIDGALPPG